MILRSKRNHTQFLCEKILRPFSQVIVELLYSQNISIEAHGQNLLLVIHCQSLQPIVVFDLFNSNSNLQKFQLFAIFNEYEGK